jgi:two-component system chemotaxis response regulator CheB
MPIAAPRASVVPRVAPKKLVVVGASTGGPQAVLELVTRLPPNTGLGIIVAQHMPERFTRTFAERLHRRATIRVAEAEDGTLVDAGSMWICPGGLATEVELDASGLARLRIIPTDATDRYAPSADRLFRTAAMAFGNRVLAVVLTGMGDDGAIGLATVKRVGGEVWVEAAETAIVDGMTSAARRTGLADAILPLPALISRLAAL